MAKPSRAPSPPSVAFLYCRVSTTRQATEGVGLETQEARCRAHAERMGWPVAEVFRDEGLSGKDGIADRPGLASLLEAVRTTPGAVVVVYSISRLARRQRLLWELLDHRDGHGLAVSSATEPFDTSNPMGRAMLGMIAVWSQLEADMVSERTRDALAEVRAQGRKLGAPTMMALGSSEAVSLARSLHAEGRSLRAVAAELNRRGILSAKGRAWHAKTVQTALRYADSAAE